MDGLTSITLERDEIKLVVNHVPACVCRVCGEAYVNEDVAVRLLERAEWLIQAGEQEEIWNFV